jgi:nicotinamide riboside kinase
MKIAIAGTHGTGKTTFAKALAEKLNLNYIPDIVREEAAKKGFTINENTPPEVQLWLVMRQWELERNTPEPWIADKSLFDYSVYGDFALKDEGVKNVINETVRRSAKYDYVFYLPIEFAMEVDGLRSASEEFRREVDRRYEKYLKDSGIKYITLSGSVEDRVNLALTHLKI